MTAVLMAVCLLTGFVVGLRVNARRLATLRELLRNSEARHDAWNLQAKATDLAEVGPVSGQSNAVELFDGAQLAEMRDDHVCTYECAGAGCDDPEPDHPCNACGKPAVFAWETDGFPFASCNLDVELWWPDGLPGHVIRLDQPGSEAECNIGGGTSTPDEANAILHPVEWVSLRCGFCGHWERGQFTKDQVAEWLRVHRNAMVGPNEGHTITASTCPHPCGTPMATPAEQTDERPPVHDFPETTVDMGGYTVTGPACESCGQPALLRWTGTEWVTLCHDCHEAMCKLADEHPDCPEAGGCRRPEQCETGCYWRRLDELNQPITHDDIDVMRAGFRGYDGCPSGDCTTPFNCSERGDCRRWPEAIGADDAARCADGGVCAYVPRGMAPCDDQCAVSLADDDEARQFLAEIRRSPGPVEDDTPKVSD